MTQAAPTTYDRPDWEHCRDEILCPLCDYELRGLSVPRCPECGYEFAWPDLLDPARRLHPYLFEHHPRHKTWSFFKTLWGGLRPRQFWTALLPSQPSRPRRLIAYWLIATLLGFIGVVAWHPDELFRGRLPGSAIFTGRLGRPFHFGGEWLSIRAEPHYVRLQVAGLPAWWHGQVEFLAAAFGLLAAWPWLTFLTLLIFQQSMGRAKVRTDHVLRCALYCGDVTFWAGVGATVSSVAAWAAHLLLPAASWPDYITIGDGGPGVLAFIVLLVILLAVAARRLWIAYRRYLHFDHAFATVLASQLMVLLLYVIVFLLHSGDVI